MNGAAYEPRRSSFAAIHESSECLAHVDRAGGEVLFGDRVADALPLEHDRQIVVVAVTIDPTISLLLREAIGLLHEGAEDRQARIALIDQCAAINGGCLRCVAIVGG